MKTLEINKAGGALRDYTQNLGKQAAIHAENGRPVAALLDSIQRPRARQASEGHSPAAEVQ
jgi:hypothetical protein